MANPPLVKSNWIVNDEGPRVIDNNRRAEERISSYYEEQSKRPVEEELNYDSFSGEFESGLNAAQLDALTMDQSNVLPTAGGDNGMTSADMAMDAGGSGDMTQMNNAVPPAAMQAGGGFSAPQGVGPAAAQAQMEAGRILDDAQTQADSIVRDAREEAERIRSQARDEGYEQGVIEGRELGVQQAGHEQDEDYERKCKQLDAEYQRTLDELEPKLVDTLTRVYEHVFDVNLANDKKIILHLLKTAMSRSGESGSFIIHVSPDDYDDVAEEKNNLRAAIPDPNTTMEIIEDPLLKSMECMIEADGGIFDCSLGVELSELSRKLRLLAFDRRRN